MAEKTEISWADMTYNAWEGCTKVSPACDHCYAERDRDHRYGTVQWGPGKPRRRMSEATRNKPYRWEREAEAFRLQHGHYPRVFASSLCDVFDNEVPDEWRTEMWQVIRDTPHLQWMLLTKRIGNATKMLPPDWPFRNAGLMSTIVTQQEFDRDWPKLRETPATWRGVSMEPLLELIDIRDERPDWIIVGGESGPAARPLHPKRVTSLRDQCTSASIPFHFKQWGEWVPFKVEPGGDLGILTRRGEVVIVQPNGEDLLTVAEMTGGRSTLAGARYMRRVGKMRAGRLLGGVEHNGFPSTERGA